MQLIKKDQQKNIQGEMCGSLIEVLNQKDFPFGIVVSEDIRSTEAHYHKESKKCYWMLEGWVDLVIENVKTGEKTSTKLEDGDLITFEPFEKHQIINASEKNKLVTISSPAWHIDDVVADIN
ncbi:MAG: cupin domain-containing protein [Candidatus Dojkabacteria bacterium]|nr:cupin domain-containing protein [Candidatus Dojkabacteria bacterium]MDQ7020899.1 cupin domain-containing protein [Candidatus Dojkabacteria bacterium]